MMTFSEYSRQIWGPNWGLCRSTPRTRAKYDRCVTRKEYAAAYDKWERLTYGAPLKSLEAAAPEMLAALKLAEERLEISNCEGEEDEALATIRAIIVKVGGAVK
jgi:hypothetical protein